MDWHATWTRRRFLKVSAGAVLAGSASTAAQTDPRPRATRVLFLNLVGGPSQLDTFDPKPEAPVDVRGPFRPIATSVPGLFLSELLPRTARLAHHLAFLRTLHHDAAPIHETGQQLTQTGRLALNDEVPPNWSSVVAAQAYATGRELPSFLLPGPLRNTGVLISQGQTAGDLGAVWEPTTVLPALPPWSTLEVESRFGPSAFGQACAAALAVLERRPALVTVNMFDTVFDQPTWDCHADGAALATTLADVQREVAPAFDQAFAALVEGLVDRGLWEETLLVATGEFGRTPRLNRRGGRDHWPHAWTAVVGGAGLAGGAVVGRTDSQGAYPETDALPAALLPSLIYRALGAQVPRARANELEWPATLEKLWA
ncbi:MAG TPA: DUF1501 domain-containing protein [Gemmatales bacterium]|nr:DUF1501 domain-containing protein [Gemmatales bacterium]HMP59427.1 DUF1501 domain-containing protein [Gemmatales bacterium]